LDPGALGGGARSPFAYKTPSPLISLLTSSSRDQKERGEGRAGKAVKLYRNFFAALSGIFFPRSYIISHRYIVMDVFSWILDIVVL